MPLALDQMAFVRLRSPRHWMLAGLMPWAMMARCLVQWAGPHLPLAVAQSVQQLFHQNEPAFLLMKEMAWRLLGWMLLSAWPPCGPVTHAVSH